MRYYGSKIYSDLELEASENCGYPVEHTLSSDLRSQASLGLDGTLMGEIPENYEIPEDAGSSVLSLITLENSRAGQSHCNFDFLNFTSWLMIASFSMNVFPV